MSNPSVHVRFKQLPIGTTFTKDSDGQRYRKISKSAVFRIKPSGVGETHAKLPFPRNAFVTSAT